MLTSIEEIHRFAPTNLAELAMPADPEPVEAARAPEEDGGGDEAPALGPIIAWWPCSANNANPPSGLNPAVMRYGHMADKAQFLDRLSPAVCDMVLYALPFGALLGSAMPFHGAQLARERGHREVINSTRDLLKRTNDKMGRLTRVYLGCLSLHYYWTNAWAGYAFRDMVWEATEPLRDEQGRPLCGIEIDVAGVMDEESREWQARCMLRSWGHPTGYEPRPMLGTPWHKYEDMGWTTTTLMRATNESGDGIGGGWAVPLSRVRGPQAVLMNQPGSIHEQAIYLARGIGVAIAGHAFNSGRPDIVRQIVDEAQRIASEVPAA